MSRIKLALTGGAVVLLVAACSSNGATSTGTNAPPSTAAQPTSSQPTSTAPPAALGTVSSSAAASTTAAAAGALSGTWNGKYSGGYQGAFTLTWQQSGGNLSGSIALSNPSITLPIHGTVAAGAIRFGTVGSVGITYVGTVSGNSMSGSYDVGAGAGGPWSASKA
jgi:hypothetical protein